jgi:hypothetical protein
MECSFCHLAEAKVHLPQSSRRSYRENTNPLMSKLASDMLGAQETHAGRNEKACRSRPFTGGKEGLLAPLPNQGDLN